MEKYGNLSEEEVRAIIEENSSKTPSDLIDKIDSGPANIRIDRRASKSLSKNQATEKINDFYARLMRLVLVDKSPNIIDLIQNSYAFDFGPLASLVQKHSLNPEKTLVRLYPALAEDNETMTLVVTLEDMEKGETITKDYSLGGLEAKTSPDEIQDEFADEICPSNPNCPKTFNSLLTESEELSYKRMISSIIQLKIAKSQRPL